MARPKRLLKICRVVDSQTAAHLARLEVDFLGFHLIEEDSDFAKVETIEAAQYTRDAFAFAGNCVLTKSTSLPFLKRLLYPGTFSYLQMHRRMDRDDLTSIRRLCDETDVKLIAMFDPGKNSPSYLEEIKKHSDLLLFDQTLGGTGRTLEGQDLDQYRGQQFLLAGGIRIEHIAECVALYDPAGFDIQTSVERAKGKKRFGAVRKIKMQLDPGFPSQKGVHRRSEVYFSATDAPLDRLPSLMSALSSVIDGVHLDHAGGIVQERYRKNSLHHASWLAAVAPDIPYDLHVCVPVTHFLSTVDEYLARNENLLRAWMQVDVSTQASRNEASELVAQLRNRGIRPGLSISADSTLEHIQAAVGEHVRRNGVSEICILGSGSQHGRTVYAERVNAVFCYLKDLSVENSSNLWCAVDLGLTDERLENLRAGSNDALIVGRALTDSDDPRSMVERLRVRLSSAQTHRRGPDR